MRVAGNSSRVRSRQIPSGRRDKCAGQDVGSRAAGERRDIVEPARARGGSGEAINRSIGRDVSISALVSRMARIWSGVSS